MTKLFLGIFISLTILSCGPAEHETVHIHAKVVMPTATIEPGEHPLGLGGLRWINRGMYWRDGTLYIPQIAKTGVSMPLLIWLHGGGGHADDIEYIFPLAEALGVVILAIDARHNTWDGIDSPFGPDVQFIDKALQYTFDSVYIDPDRIALGGLSDGASYALALGRVNGDFFTHLIAVAPRLVDPPGLPIGQPQVFVAHGTRDNVYSVVGTRRYIVPVLKRAGYDVTYVEFDGAHWVPIAVASEALEWLKR